MKFFSRSRARLPETIPLQLRKILAKLLSSHQEHIFDLFGQIPDVLEDVWVEVAVGNKEKAREIIDALPQQHPFEMKYNRIEQLGWESCSEVLNDIERREKLLEGR